MRRLLGKLKRQIPNVGLTSLVVLVTLGILLAAWWAWFKSHPKVISGFNFYRTPISVLVEGKKYDLQPFDTYVHQTTTTGEIKLTVVDSEGKQLAEKKHTFTNKIHAAVDILSQKDQLKLCFVTADVTGLYYQIPDQTAQITRLSSIVDEPQASVNAVIDHPFDELLYPGNYHIDQLPERLPGTADLYGLFPVDCSKRNDATELVKELSWWANYDSTSQRELLNQKLEEIQDSPEYAK